MALHLLFNLISSSVRMYGERLLSRNRLEKNQMASRDNYYFQTIIPAAVCLRNLSLFCTKFHLVLSTRVFLNHFCLILLLRARRNRFLPCFSPQDRHLQGIRPSQRAVCRFLLKRVDCYRKPLLTKTKNNKIQILQSQNICIYVSAQGLTYDFHHL
jgi:hypothetical protein